MTNRSVIEKGRIYYRAVTIGVLLPILIGSCSMSRKVNPGEINDSGIETATNLNNSSGANLAPDTSLEDIQQDSLTETGLVDRAAEFDSNHDQKAPVVAQTADELLALIPPRTIHAESSEDLPIGQWLGQTEERYGDGCLQSKRVTMQIAPSENGSTAFGYVIFGDGDRPQKATDPKVGYPTDITAAEFSETNGSCYLNSPMDGFPYTIRDGRITEDGRFILRIVVIESYESWCLLQDSHLHTNRGDPFYTCIPELSQDEMDVCAELGDSMATNLPENVECPIDYLKYLLCIRGSRERLLGPCICVEDGCVFNMNRSIRFDLAFDSTTDEEFLEGVLTNLSGNLPPAMEVKLRRVD